MSFFAVILGACNPSGVVAVEQTPLPTTLAGYDDSQQVRAAAEHFLDAWRLEDYHRMYGMLTPLSQHAFTEEKFAFFYRETAIGLALQRLDCQILSILISRPGYAQVAYRVIFTSAVVDELKRDMVMNLSLVGEEWRVQWEQSQVLPDLQEGNRLVMDISPTARGNIYDRNGDAIVTQSDAYALGVNPAEISPDDEKGIVAALVDLCGKTPDDIRALIASQPNETYVAIGDSTAEAVNRRLAALSGLKGLILKPYSGRYYFEHGVAPQTVGYAMAIPVEQIDEYRRKGYRGDERVGVAGLEKWGENDLMGQRGADLYVVNPQGGILTRLAHREAKPAQSVYTTLDRSLQVGAQQAMRGFRGAAIVLERETGRILAMVSSPGFDPNLFELKNPNSSLMLTGVITDEGKPLLNRATQGGYPLGSVFKVVTMAAALESGYYHTDSKYFCGYEFKELGGMPLYDWTYAMGLPASGELTLSEGLMRSCNPWFWHIGLDLYLRNEPLAVSEMARAFGLGKPTGLKQTAEDGGSFPDPANPGDAVQLAIGQGTMLATPLQGAVFIAALGNGGTLYRPQLVEKIVTPEGLKTYSFQPVVNGHLPIKPENLTAIQTAMRMVVNDKRGTAYHSLYGFEYPVFGKTGTAQNPFDEPHAWFAGFTNAGRADKPDVAAIVIAENAGEGSMVAAPIFRRILEIYFYGKPLTLYSWEKQMSDALVPTPFPTQTPTPVPLRKAGQ